MIIIFLLGHNLEPPVRCPLMSMRIASFFCWKPLVPFYCGFPFFIHWQYWVLWSGNWATVESFRYDLTVHQYFRKISEENVWQWVPENWWKKKTLRRVDCSLLYYKGRTIFSPCPPLLSPGPTSYFLSWLIPLTHLQYKLMLHYLEAGPRRAIDFEGCNPIAKYWSYFKFKAQIFPLIISQVPSPHYIE